MKCPILICYFSADENAEVDADTHAAEKAIVASILQCKYTTVFSAATLSALATSNGSTTTTHNFPFSVLAKTPITHVVSAHGRHVNESAQTREATEAKRRWLGGGLGDGTHRSEAKVGGIPQQNVKGRKEAFSYR